VWQTDRKTDRQTNRHAAFSYSPVLAQLERDQKPAGQLMCKKLSRRSIFGPTFRYLSVLQSSQRFSSDRSYPSRSIAGKPITRNRSPTETGGRPNFRWTITKEIRPFGACNKPIYYTIATYNLFPLLYNAAARINPLIMSLLRLKMENLVFE